MVLFLGRRHLPCASALGRHRIGVDLRHSRQAGARAGGGTNRAGTGLCMYMAPGAARQWRSARKS